VEERRHYSEVQVFKDKYMHTHTRTTCDNRSWMAWWSLCPPVYSWSHICRT